MQEVKVGGYLQKKNEANISLNDWSIRKQLFLFPEN